MRRANPCTNIAFFNSRLNKRFHPIQFDSRLTRAVVRQEFLADMAAQLRRTKVKRRHLVESISLAADGAVTVVGACDETPFAETFDMLIAADGIHSVVRKQLFPQLAQTHDRGFSCIYMLLEGSEADAPQGFMQRANSGRSELIMGQICTLTMFPLGRGKLALGIGLDHAVRDQLWNEAGLPPNLPWADIEPSTKAAIARKLTEDAGDPMLVDALGLVPDWNSYKIYLWAMRDTDALEQPFAPHGNVIVLGDAAHAIMPTIGMGASLAIEDSEALCRLVRNSGLSRDQTPAAFRAGLHKAVFEPFVRARVPVWKDLIGRARRAAQCNFINVAQKRRFAIGPQIPGALQSRVVSGIEAVMSRLGL